MKPIVIPENFNYIGVFITFRCRYDCSYCINKFSAFKKRKEMEWTDLVKGLNRITSRPDLPITIQGGEPTEHKYFYDIIASIKPELDVDLLTNLNVDVEKFEARIPKERFKLYDRKLPYANIRVSYHYDKEMFWTLCYKVKTLMEYGRSIGIWEVEHPRRGDHCKSRQRMAKMFGIDYRLKEYLGIWNEKLYGTYRYPEAVGRKATSQTTCRTSELLIDPAGSIYRCHTDLYAGKNQIGHILDPEPPRLGIWRECSSYGNCSPCDIKTKFNRFQQEGHCAVEINTPTTSGTV